MKKLTRFILGVISSVLLSAGLSRAADKLDVIDSNPFGTNRSVAPTPDSIQNCNLLDEQN